jgi:leucyl aminopeptidase
VIGFEAVAGRASQAQADVLVLPCYAGQDSAPEPGPGCAEAAGALGIDLPAALRARGFGGAIGDTFATLTLGRLASAWMLVIGVGPRAECGPGAVREAAMRAAKELTRARSIAVVLPAAEQPGRSGLSAMAAAFAEGFLLGGYQFDHYRTQPVTPGWHRPATEVVRVLTDDGSTAVAGTTGVAETTAVAEGLQRGRRLADLTNWVRDLVNAPPSDTTPDDMAERARELAATHGLACSVLTVPQLRAGGFGGILGVGQGSTNEPKLVELSYRGGGDGPVIGMTGKGITFDSGGISLKRDSEIEWMKSDMAGAAAVMATLRGAAEFGLPVNIDAVIPFAENMPGGSAQRPGDVLTHRGGRASEIRDTDSEGRLIIADALAYLAERKPATLIDVATLTDAAGLGEDLWAVLGTDERQIGELIEAGEQAGDPGWRLPLPPSYRKYLASAAADIRNTPAGVPDTTIMAAMYLREFTGGVPWLHIDNGSTAYLDRDGVLWPEGATGSPTRALLRWVERFAASGGPERGESADRVS